MNYQAIFLLIILIGGLLLCSFLGGYQCYKEGFSCSIDNGTIVGYTFTNTSNSNTANITLDDNYSIVVTDTTGITTKYIGPTSTFTASIVGPNFQGPDGAFAVIENDSCCNSFIRITRSDGTIDRYKQDTAVECDEYTSSYSGGSYSGGSSSNALIVGQCGAMDTTTIITTTYYGPTGGTASITIVDGVYQMKVTDSTGTTSNYVYQSPYSTTSTIEGAVFKGPYGGAARVIFNGDCKAVVEITFPSGEIVVYTTQPSSNPSPSPPPVNSSPPPPPSTYPSCSTPANYYSDSNSNGGGYNYSSSLPTGIPSSQIPSGQQDLYILKSEIVPPVCPVCPSNNASSKGKKCPPCPACARCPDTSSSDFHCKKVPTYKKNDKNHQDEIMPVAVLKGFSTYGM